jgi:MFS family permease
MVQPEQSVVPPASPAGAVESPPRMKRVATASLVGTVVEFYDYNIFGTAAALVFPVIFFPALGPIAGTVASFATLGVAFLFRPLGSIVFGALGDRVGRKATLVTTLLIMGAATTIVGVLPTASQIGVAAPILLVVMRVAQGIAAGGEYAGAVLFTSENSDARRRGFWGAIPNLGGGLAIVLANATFLVFALAMGNEAFLSWGWRVPFLLSAVLVLFGLWVRLRTEETVAFRRRQERAASAPQAGPPKAPFIEVLRMQGREVALVTGVMVSKFTLTYVGGTYLINYGSRVLEFSRPTVLVAGILAGLTSCTGMIIGAVASDRFGRKRVMMIMAAVSFVWVLVLFPVIDNGSAPLFAIGVGITMLCSGIGTGPLGAYLSELFDTRYRYTAVGFTYAFAGVVGGGIMPLVATPIIENWGSLAFGGVFAALCAIAILCVSRLHETKGSDLDLVGTVRR